MKFTGDEEEKVMEALASVYSKRDEVEVGDAWQGRVMSSIGRLGISGARQSFQESIERLAWRLAPVAAGLILVLAVGIVRFDLVSDFELTNMLVGEATDFSLLPFLET
jgi:hypothetical protein